MNNFEPMNRIYIVLLFVFVMKTNAQSGESSSVKWKQIDTEKVKVVFATGMESQAQRVANKIHEILENNTESIGGDYSKVSILLHNNTTVTNGFVSSFFFRSEFFISSPPQSHKGMSSGDWVELLTIHEFRHVLQYANSQKGISKWLRVIVGDYGLSTSVFLAAPDWFYEGDAVATETALTLSGRGRNPYFTAHQRAILKDGEDYSYSKYKNGSYKDKIPSYYTLGYLMSNYARNNYGNNILKDVYSQSSSLKGSFSRNLDRETGLNTEELFKKSLTDLHKRYSSNINKQKITITTPLIERNKNKEYVNYSNPKMDEGIVYAIKSDMKSLPRLVSVSQEGLEEEIVEIGNIQSSNYFSVSKGMVAWSGYNSSARWEHKNYRNIIVYNIKTKHKKQITFKSKYVSPSLSDDASKIVVVETKSDMSNNLVILDTETGEVLKTINCDFLPVFPKWKDNALYFIARNDSKNSIKTYDLNTDIFDDISPETYINFSNLSYKSGNYYFSAGFDGVDNVYRFNAENKYLDKVTSVSIGAYDVFANEDRVMFSEITNSKGAELRYVNINDIDYKRVGFDISLKPEIESDLLAIKTIKEDIKPSDYKSVLFSVSDYKRFRNAINIHSWGAYYSGNTINTYVLSNNLLGDLSAVGNLYYNFQTKTARTDVLLQYSKCFTVFNASLGQVLSKQKYHSYLEEGKHKLGVLNWDEKKYSLGLEFPMTFNKYSYSQQLNLKVNFISSSIEYNDNQLYNYNTNNIEYKLSFSNYKAMSYRDIIPAFGQKIEVEYLKNIDGNSEQFMFNSWLLFKGLAENHNFFIGADYMFKTVGSNNYYFDDKFVYSRGYQSLPYNDDIYKLSFNYTLPLFYPDLNALGSIYIKRIYANLFYDMSKTNNIKKTEFSRNYDSYGISLKANINVLDKIPLMISYNYFFLINDEFLPGLKNSTNSYFSFILDL